MITIPFNALKRTKKFQLTNPLKQTQGFCYACGKQANFRYQSIITDSLAKDWALSAKERHSFNCRESLVCESCSNSLRTRVLAKTLVKLFGQKAKSLKDLAAEEKFLQLQVAEINSCGNLHQFLASNPNVHYSEFGSKDPGIKHEDIQNLTYEDAKFDIVLTSETLEHVADTDTALREIKRVLKPGGAHIFTIPIILNRQTRHRLGLKSGKVNDLLPKSYHGEEEIGFLVAHEFGGDVLDLIENSGFKTGLYYTYPFIDTHSYVIVAVKE